MNTLTINLFGGPGTGKSTLCAKIFVALKMQGFEVEMAPEYVKDLVWEESFKKIENQLYIFGKQHNRIYRLLRKVKVIITDSPLLNSIIYYSGDNPHFIPMVLWEHNAMNNLNFYIPRTFEYVENGRTQNLDGAKEVDRKYEEFLKQHNIPYHIFLPNQNHVDEIVNFVRISIGPGKVPGDI
jgi:nicotinamide riboside kinase